MNYSNALNIGPQRFAEFLRRLDATLQWLETHPERLDVSIDAGLNLGILDNRTRVYIPARELLHPKNFNPDQLTGNVTGWFLYRNPDWSWSRQGGGYDRAGGNMMLWLRPQRNIIEGTLSVSERRKILW